MSLMNGNGGLSAADIAAVMGNSNGGYGFNGDGAWWLVIIMLFALTGGNWEMQMVTTETLMEMCREDLIRQLL